MKQVTGDFEIVDEGGSFFAKHPGFAWTIVLAAMSGMQFLVGYWEDERQRPKWEKVYEELAEIKRDMTQDSRALATFDLERDRYETEFWRRIADSANVKMPKRPKELDRAEKRVRDIQERVN